jgi:hypothetical protein
LKWEVCVWSGFRCEGVNRREPDISGQDFAGMRYSEQTNKYAANMALHIPRKSIRIFRIAGA